MNHLQGKPKTMKRLTFVIVGAAVLALSGCNKGNQDQVDNAVMNQPSADQLNALANEAANDAANAPAPVANKADENAAAPVDNTANPTDAQEQNVSGM
jgi:protein involved in sex pheromone biosynthesis